MVAWPMRVTMQQASAVRLLQCRFCPCVVDVCIDCGRVVFVLLTLHAQLTGDVFTLCKGFGQETLLPSRLPHGASEGLVIHIAQAAFITVGQQPALTCKIQHTGVC